MGGVATGTMNAKDAEMVAGIIRYRGWMQRLSPCNIVIVHAAWLYIIICNTVHMIHVATFSIS